MDNTEKISDLKLINASNQEVCLIFFVKMFFTTRIKNNNTKKVLKRMCNYKPRLNYIQVQYQQGYITLMKINTFRRLKFHHYGKKMVLLFIS